MSSWIESLLRRPVGVSAGLLLIVVLGTVAVLRLPVALLPSLDYPSLLIWTAYPDAPPAQIERGVTEVVERAVAGLPGLVTIESRSQLGGSLLQLDFAWNTDLDLVTLQLREEVDRIGAYLPESAGRPVVLKNDPGVRPVLVLAMGLAGSRLVGEADLVELKEIARDVVARRLEQLGGVARVRITGGHEREIQVQLSPEAMAASGLDLEHIASALAANNTTLSGGLVRRGPFLFTLEVSGELARLSDIGSTVVSSPPDPPVQLYQVASLDTGVADRRGMTRLDGDEVLLLMVEGRPEANTVETAAAARGALNELAEQLPGLRFEVLIDESHFVIEVLRGVFRAALLGGVLAVLVLFAFLRQRRAVLAIAISIPLSVFITLVLCELLGVTVNLLSLSGLALGIGMLVDNAIVVTESVARRQSGAANPISAAAQGTSDVMGAVIAGTLTTIAVFLPLSFVEGLAGRLFRDQSIAVVASLLASLLVAVTAVPLVLSRRGRSEQSQRAEPVRRRSPASDLHGTLIGACLRRPVVFAAGCIGLLVIAWWLAFRLPREVVPASAESRVEASISLPPATDLNRLASLSAELERTFGTWPEVARVLADLGERDEARLDLDPRLPHRGDLTLFLNEQVASLVIERIMSLPLPPGVSLEARPFRSRLESLLVDTGSDLAIDLQSESSEAGAAAADILLTRLQQLPELTNVARAEAQSTPGYQLHLNHDALLRFGVRPKQLERVIEVAARGQEATRLRTIGDEIPIVLHSPRPSSLNELLATRVPGRAGLLPLSSLVTARQVELPTVLLRSDRMAVTRLEADLAEGSGLETALPAIQAKLEHSPHGVEARIRGANESFRASLRAVGLSLMLSLALIYLILAAQFESLLQPLIVLSIAPLAAAGVTLSLALFGQSWNLFSLTGCVLLVGISVNDSILKVDCINRHLGAGKSLDKAILAASAERTRPVLMTSLTTILALLPLALGLGEGGSLRSPLAIAVAGGLATSTLLTLVVVPVLYGLARRHDLPPGSGYPSTTDRLIPG